MLCKLCNTEKELIKRSHIIPDFLYHGLFNETHFIATIELEDFKNRKRIPTGVYDKHLLCRDCDNRIIGRFESYARNVLLGCKGNIETQPIIEQRINQLNRKYLHVKNINYSKFKLFLLSILWRASISEQNFFKSIKLSVEHETAIGKMILDNNPKSVNDYPIGLFLFEENTSFNTKLIASPIKIENTKMLSYVFLINGLSIHYKIHGDNDDEFFTQIGLKETGEIDVYIYDEENGKKYFDNYLGYKLRYKEYFTK